MTTKGRNKLDSLSSRSVPHFILKSYIQTIFEYERKKEEYHIYWLNKRRKFFDDEYKYCSLSYKKMTKNEISFFKNSLDSYKKALDNKYGCVWEHKDIEVRKSLFLSKFVKNNQ
jgi:hypothetical protein|tara:strand:+ start:158 stop:499 length:342 start_codon:yes stop_codon:yes gene_type:complete